jgi:hypothetical protein
MSPRDLQKQRVEAAMQKRLGIVQPGFIPRTAIAGPIPPKVNRFFHTGDIGDAIAAMPIVRELGGGVFSVGDVPMRLGHGRRQSMEGERFESLKTLLEVQPYIREIIWEKLPTRVTHDFSTFRTTFYRPGENITNWQARHIKVPSPDMSPWLTLEPNPDAKGRVIVARSPRYHIGGFPWKEILAHLGDAALFVGLQSEHETFCDDFGVKLEKAKTDNLLEVAQTIAGAEACIVNQTGTFWVACGLGVPIIQELFPDVPNSIVRRPNTFYPIGPLDYAQVIARLEEFTAKV